MRQSIPPIILALTLALLIVTPLAFLTGRRGGRFRSLPGWVGSWVLFAGLLVALGRVDRAFSFPLLGLLMFMGLRQYFFLTPLRPQDRWAILASYASIPFSLWPVFRGNYDAFLLVVAALLFLLLLFLISLASQQHGFFDSTGRVLVGALVFVLCAGHLGVMAGAPRGWLELFGILALMGDLPQRLAGRLRATGEPGRTIWGVASGAATAAMLGALLGPLVGIRAGRGAVAGVIVAIAVGAGARVADAVAEDLTLSAAVPIVGRRAFLDRTIPALFAAPFFYVVLKILP